MSRGLRQGVLIVVVLGAVAVNLFAIGLGGWHLWRYVVAPRAGLVDEDARWQEGMRVATSAFRRLDEKERALDNLLALRSHASTLTEAVRARDAAALDDVVLQLDYPLDLKYKAARVQAMLRGNDGGAGAPPGLRREATPSAEPGPDAAAALHRLDTLSGAVGPAFREHSAERTRLVVELFRSRPCDPDLARLVRSLVDREDLGTVERSFLFGVRREQEQRCP